MFTAATFLFARALGLEWLLIIPRLFIYVALAAWSLTFIGMISHLVAKDPGGGVGVA